MARSERYDESVSSEDYDQIREGITESFEELYQRLAEETGKNPEDFKLDSAEMDAWVDDETSSDDESSD